MEVSDGTAVNMSDFGKDWRVVVKVNIQCADSTDKAVSHKVTQSR